MSDTTELATETASLGKELVKDLGIAAAETVVATAGAVVVLLAFGYAVSVRNERRAKKALAVSE